MLLEDPQDMRLLSASLALPLRTIIAGKCRLSRDADIHRFLHGLHASHYLCSTVQYSAVQYLINGLLSFPNTNSRTAIHVQALDPIFPDRTSGSRPTFCRFPTRQNCELRADQLDLVASAPWANHRGLWCSFLLPHRFGK